MSESLLSDLTDVKLIAKERHRRKRRLIKLNKSKRQRLLSEQQNDNHKYGKYKKSKYNQESVLNIYLDISTTTTTATLIIDDDDYYYYYYYDDTINDEIISYDDNNDNYNKQQTENNNNNNDNNTQQQQQKQQQQQQQCEDISISSYFESMECDYFSRNRSKKTYLEFPSKFMYHIKSLYESSSISTEQNDINGLLKSARSWNDNEYGQVVIIGSYLDELIKIFKENENMDNILPMDIIYTISELTGSAIIWLRKPGLNIFKWSVNTKIKYNIYNKYKYEFYFSGYIGNDIMMKELLLLNNCNNKYNQYLDLDWCFVAFLLLGLIPKYQNSYFKWYFNQKLLSSFSPSFPFKYLLKQ